MKCKRLAHAALDWPDKLIQGLQEARSVLAVEPLLRAGFPGGKTGVRNHAGDEGKVLGCRYKGRLTCTPTSTFTCSVDGAIMCVPIPAPQQMRNPDSRSSEQRAEEGKGLAVEALFQIDVDVLSEFVGEGPDRCEVRFWYACLRGGGCWSRVGRGGWWGEGGGEEALG